VIDIALITKSESFARLRCEWEELWARDPAATPFQSPAWQLAWWRCFGTPELLVLTARAGGELVGLLPLYLLREAGCRKLLPVGVGLSDYIEALAAPGADGTAERFMREIAATPGWDECWLPDLTPGGALATASLPRDLAAEMSAARSCPVLRLPGRCREIADLVPRHTSRYLRHARARTAAAGVAMAEMISESGLDAALDDLFRLHELRWRARGEAGVCADPPIRAFHKSAAYGLAANGMLRLYRLRIGRTAAAVFYGIAAKRVFYAYLGGFDPALASLRPGAQLIAHAVEQAAAEEALEFDFLRGGEPYKYAWGAADRTKVLRCLRRA
jgi:CelD/BcsL family acetyltransferase involved in cellulose biosynthesis